MNPFPSRTAAPCMPAQGAFQTVMLWTPLASVRLTVETVTPSRLAASRRESVPASIAGRSASRSPLSACGLGPGIDVTSASCCRSRTSCRKWSPLWCRHRKDDAEYLEAAPSWFVGPSSFRYPDAFPLALTGRVVLGVNAPGRTAGKHGEPVPQNGDASTGLPKGGDGLWAGSARRRRQDLCLPTRDLRPPRVRRMNCRGSCLKIAHVS